VGRIVDPPHFLPPTLFEIEKKMDPQFVFQGVPVSTEIITFLHDVKNFQLYYEKELTKKDVKSDFWYNFYLYIDSSCRGLSSFQNHYLICMFGVLLQKLFYQGFCQLTLSKKTTFVLPIDDRGNKWNCITIYGTRPCNHLKIDIRVRLLIFLLLLMYSRNSLN